MSVYNEVLDLQDENEELRKLLRECREFVEKNSTYTNDADSLLEKIDLAL